MINAGGHRNLVTDTTPGGAQDSFFNNALVPMLQRYAANRNIIGWEIMNEPEWALNQNPYTRQNPTVTGARRRGPDAGLLPPLHHGGPHLRARPVRHGGLGLAEVHGLWPVP